MHVASHGGVPESRVGVLGSGAFLKIEPSFRVKDMEVDNEVSEPRVAMTLLAGSLSRRSAALVHKLE